MLARHVRESHNANFERNGYCRELCVVCEVGLEEVLGLGNAADFRVRGVRRMRDFSLPRRAGKPGQGNEPLDVWTGRRRDGGPRRVDVGVGCGRRRGSQAVCGGGPRCRFPTDGHAVEHARDARVASGRARVSSQQGHWRVRGVARRTREEPSQNPHSSQNQNPKECATPWLNAVTGKVGPSTNMSDYPTNQDLLTLKPEIHRY